MLADLFKVSFVDRSGSSWHCLSLSVMCVSKALEQDKYSLQKEVELKTRMLESLQSDYDCVKNQQRQQLHEQQEHLERSHSAAITDLNNKV